MCYYYNNKETRFNWFHNTYNQGSDIMKGMQQNLEFCQVTWKWKFYNE